MIKKERTSFPRSFPKRVGAPFAEPAAAKSGTFSA